MRPVENCFSTVFLFSFFSFFMSWLILREQPKTYVWRNEAMKDTPTGGQEVRRHICEDCPSPRENDPNLPLAQSFNFWGHFTRCVYKILYNTEICLNHNSDPFAFVEKLLIRVHPSTWEAPIEESTGGWGNTSSEALLTLVWEWTPPWHLQRNVCSRWVVIFPLLTSFNLITTTCKNSSVLSKMDILMRFLLWVVFATAFD